jgi:hypothetical protein
MCISQVAINSALFWSIDIHSLLQNKSYYSILSCFVSWTAMVRILHWHVEKSELKTTKSKNVRPLKKYKTEEKYVYMMWNLLSFYVVTYITFLFSFCMYNNQIFHYQLKNQLKDSVLLSHTTVNIFYNNHVFTHFYDQTVGSRKWAYPEKCSPLRGKKGWAVHDSTQEEFLKIDL